MALLAVAALLGFNLYESHREIETTQRDRLVHQVSIVERNLAHQLQITSNALEAIRDELPDLIKQPAILNHRLAATIKASSGIRTFVVVNRDGDAIASNRQALVGRNFREESRYRAILQANDPSVLHVSEPYRTPLGNWAIALSRSIRDASGSFDGYILAVTDPEYFDNLLTSVLYAPDVRAGLIHGQGKLIYRAPDPEGITGMDLSKATESAFYRHVQSGEPLTVLTSTRTASGRKGMVASRTILPRSVKVDYPLVAYASRETAIIFAPWWKQLGLSVFMFGLLTLAAMYGLFVYQRRRVANERLRQADQQLRMATDGAKIGIWYWDHATGKLDWSERCKIHLGLPLEQQGSFEHFYAAMHPDDRERIAALLKRSEEALEDYQAEYRVVHPDGTELWLEALGRYFLNAQGAVVAMGGITLDITQRKLAERQIKQGKRQVELLNRQLDKRAIDAETAKRAKDAFLMAISHELRTPLNHIVAGTDILLSEPFDTKQAQWLHGIKEAANNLMHLIQQVLLAAKKASDGAALEQVEFSPATVLDEVRQILLQRAEAKGLTVILSDTKDLPERLIGDATRLAQALFNYLDNAIKFTERGSVTLSAQTITSDAEGVLVRFAVSDTGIGIDPEIKDKLFIAFTQGDSSSTRKYGGLGIGLSNTRELARLMGGDVGAENVAGGGATFWLTARFKQASDATGKPDVGRARGNAIQTRADAAPVAQMLASEGQASGLDRAALRAVLEELEPLLVSGDFHAQELVRAKAHLLRSACGNDAAKLQQAAEDFDFDAALAALAIIKERIPKDA